MLFCYYPRRHAVISSSYLVDYKISTGILSTVKTGAELSPYYSAAIDLSKHIAYKKMHQEHLERYRIAHNMKNQSEVMSFDFIKGEICTHNRSVLGYGFNQEYGVMDTTGTASGIYSNLIKEKALLELIEKNEAMLIWYLQKGMNVLIDKYTKQLIKKIGFHSEELYIFSSNNICNLDTFVVLLFHNKRIVGTGVSIDKNSKIGLTNALLEAKTMECVYTGLEASPFNVCTSSDHKRIYEYVNNISVNMGTTNLKEKVNENIIISSWVTSIEVAILNTQKFQEYATIRCFSKEMLNCVPCKKNILESIDKKIFKEFKLNHKIISERPSCIIL